MRLASSEWRPGMLLHSLQSAGQPPPRGTNWLQMAMVQELRALGEGNVVGPQDPKGPDRKKSHHLCLPS